MRSPLVVIHTADFHGDRHGGRGLALVASLLKAEPHAVWLDSGDAVGTPNITLGLLRDPILNRMGRMGCVAMALGNREFELWPWALRRKLPSGAPPVVCTNLSHPRPETIPVRCELILRARDGARARAGAASRAPTGARVRVFGLLRDMVRGPVARAVSAFRFADPFSALHEALDAAALAAEEWVVVLSHLGRETDVALLERFPRVDLVLGGHSHEAYAHVESGRASCAPAPYGGSVALVHAEGPLGAASVSVELVPSDGGRVR